MLGKLLKYDFRSMLKQFAFVWPAALVLALVNRFTVNSFVASASSVRQTISGVAMLVYVAILIAMFVLAVIFVIQRFYKGLLGDEGYLMHTLPVRPWQLISSKLICAVVVTVVSILVAILSILLIVPLKGEDFRLFWQEVGILLQESGPHAALIILEVVIAILAGMAQSFLQLYLAMAIGHLFSKHRVAMSAVAYIALNAVMSFLPSYGGFHMLNGIYTHSNRLLGGDGLTGSFWSLWHSGIWLSIAGCLVIAAVYFFATSYILKNKLNLE